MEVLKAEVQPLADKDKKSLLSRKRRESFCVVTRRNVKTTP